MKNLIINVFIIIVVALLNCSVVFAWDDKVTHPALTQEAIEKLRGNGWLESYFKNNLGFQDDVATKLS